MSTASGGGWGAWTVGGAAACVALALTTATLSAQGVTTGALGGLVRGPDGEALDGAFVLAVHDPSGTRYSTLSREGGAYTIPNMRVGGPYTVTAEMIGFATGTQEGIVVQLGQTVQVDFSLQLTAVELGAIVVTADPTLNRDRTGAATFVEADAVAQLPSVRRSTRDLIRTDPRNDGNLAFAGRNWLFNNVSLDGSYFSNPFGLDDPAPGGQANAEPIPFEAVEQVQVSIAPFDVRQGGFTGANVNTVTKSGTNDFTASAYTYYRNESFIGNEVRGRKVVANPELTFNQSGFTASGPIQRDKLFLFVNGEIERRDDPGTNFVANTDASVDFGESRVSSTAMDMIRDRMITEYGYDPGPYQGYIHETDSNKLLAKLDWNVNENHNVMFRYSYLDGSREQGPHPFVLSFNNAGRGPNASSLPFEKSGYRINNQLNSFALEVNSRLGGSANRFFASYNRFRDFREPFSEGFPTVEIGEGGVGYTTLGHEPFSIHNILDQDVLQLTNNFTLFRGRHDLTFGANFEWFGFFNSFNIFRHGVFFLPASEPIGSTFSSVAEFMTETANGAKDFDSMIGTGPFKGENIDVGQLSIYVQDEFRATERLNLTAGVRLDLPMYSTDPVDNEWSRSLVALDGLGTPEIVDQSTLPGASPLFSPRLGFNWDVTGDRSTQLRGGTGVFTGRIPFVWFGNVISNPGANPEIWSPTNSGVPQVPTSDDAILQQSFDLNAMDADFKWPQVWMTDIAVDQLLPWDMIGTVELIYGSDINGIIMRNADLVAPERTLADGRPYYGGNGNNELNPDGGAGIYVIDNTDEGHNVNVTAQLRKSFNNGLSASLAYSFTEAKNALKSTEIASVLWQNQPVQGNPNAPEVSFSEFGQRHRFVATATHTIEWMGTATHLGLFVEVAQGNRFTAAGGNRYSFIYAGDVNGDGPGGNDLIYIPRDQSEINLADPSDWAALDAFIEQDDYLSQNRGRIAERMGALNPWYNDIDLRVLQDIYIQSQTLQLSVDILNVANLLNSDWGVRKVANPAATSPLSLTGFDGAGEPIFDFTGPSETFIDDPSVFSRWQIQIGAKLTVS